MRFAFTEDQELFRQALAEMLEKECPHEVLAEAWASAAGRVPGLWEKLAEMGVVGLTTPEEGVAQTGKPPCGACLHRPQNILGWSGGVKPLQRSDRAKPGRKSLFHASEI